MTPYVIPLEIPDKVHGTNIFPKALEIHIHLRFDVFVLQLRYTSQEWSLIIRKFTSITNKGERPTVEPFGKISTLPKEICSNKWWSHPLLHTMGIHLQKYWHLLQALCDKWLQVVHFVPVTHWPFWMQKGVDVYNSMIGSSNQGDLSTTPGHRRLWGGVSGRLFPNWYVEHIIQRNQRFLLD